MAGVMVPYLRASKFSILDYFRRRSNGYLMNLDTTMSLNALIVVGMHDGKNVRQAIAIPHVIVRVIVALP